MVGAGFDTVGGDFLYGRGSVMSYFTLEGL